MPAVKIEDHAYYLTFKQVLNLANDGIHVEGMLRVCVGGS